jgi:hypothetical protein
VPKEIATESPDREVRRYVRHWADAEFVEQNLANRHSSLTADQRRKKSRQVAFNVGQGLEYLDSAREPSLLTKPLPLFYAAENLAKAACIMRDPPLVGSDFRAHGLINDQATRYSVKNLCCKVGPVGRDVWSRLFSHCNADVIRLEDLVDGSSQISDHRIPYATKPLARDKVLTLGDVLRHIPELEDNIVYANWGHPYVVRAISYQRMIQSQPSRMETFEFMLTHEHNQATKNMVIDRESDVLKQYTRNLDQLDALGYTATAPRVIKPVMRLDMFGRIHMDFRRTSVVLSEPCLHYIALFILSSAVRYLPEQWKRLTDDHPAEAILVDRYLDVAARKYPNLILNELLDEVFLFRVIT